MRVAQIGFDSFFFLEKKKRTQKFSGKRKGGISSRSRKRHKYNSNILGDIIKELTGEKRGERKK